MKISCVMPTYNRQEFIKAAILCYQQQTYQTRELVILDDSTNSVEPLVPTDDPTIHYHRLATKHNTGDKRNMINALTTGDIIAHFDDDDWSDPQRLQHQYDLLKAGANILTGYRTTLFWNPGNQRAYYFKSHIPNCVYGCAITYWKSYWEANNFASTRTGSDFKFVMDTIDRVACSLKTTHIVSRIHNTNVSIKPNYPLDPALLPAGFWANECYRLETL